MIANALAAGEGIDAGPALVRVHEVLAVPLHHRAACLRTPPNAEDLQCGGAPTLWNCVDQLDLSGSILPWCSYLGSPAALLTVGGPGLAAVPRSWMWPLRMLVAWVTSPAAPAVLGGATRPGWPPPVSTPRQLSLDQQDLQQYRWPRHWWVQHWPTRNVHRQVGSAAGAGGDIRWASRALGLRSSLSV